MPNGTVTSGSPGPGSHSYQAENKACWQSTWTNISGSKNALSDFTYNKCTGVHTPNFNARVKAGELLPHTLFEKIDTSGRAGLAKFNYEYNWNGTCYNFRTTGETIRYSHFTGVNPDEQWWVTMQSMVNECASDLDYNYYVQKAASAIYTRGHDTLTFLAEIRQVRRMFKSIIQRIISLPFGKFDLGGRALAGDWLTARYGIRPLMYDISDLSEAVSQLGEERKRFSERQGTRTEYNRVIDLSSTGADTSIESTLTIVTELSLRGSVTADIDPPSFRFNAVTTAWEKTPWSFVLDWLLNIGMWLESLSFASLSTEHYASGGYQIKQTKTATYRMYGPAMNGDRHTVMVSDGVLKRRYPTEIPLTPQLLLRLDAFKVTDLIALAYQRFNHRR